MLLSVTSAFYNLLHEFGIKKAPEFNRGLQDIMLCRGLVNLLGNGHYNHIALNRDPEPQNLPLLEDVEPSQ